MASRRRLARSEDWPVSRGFYIHPYRVLQSIDPVALKDVVHRWTRSRLPLAKALAADRQCIRTGTQFEIGRTL